jgi:hypothetical protein
VEPLPVSIKWPISLTERSLVPGTSLRSVLKTRERCESPGKPPRGESRGCTETKKARVIAG